MNEGFISSDYMETLEDWAGFERAQINAFVDYYLAGIEDRPELFPKKLPAGEFDEQYRIWVQS